MHQLRASSVTNSLGKVTYGISAGYNNGVVFARGSVHIDADFASGDGDRHLGSGGIGRARLGLEVVVELDSSDIICPYTYYC